MRPDTQNQEPQNEYFYSLFLSLCIAQAQSLAQKANIVNHKNVVQNIFVNLDGVG